jgi:hypothetical protein
MQYNASHVIYMQTFRYIWSHTRCYNNTNFTTYFYGLQWASMIDLLHSDLAGPDSIIYSYSRNKQLYFSTPEIIAIKGEPPYLRFTGARKNNWKIKEINGS